ncbi:MarR family winged helix-turn-helix transcriptional regulator [Arachnia rubra]|jgi:transcriptional regulator pecS|uniref:Winged helix-turn-helix transcriptional regulator n=1 Tax=Arachnia rubra TaxID=1547448 RepID=A0ABX7Y454_9ACTN|nr:MarR family winged helix-turn-helix transcriptional regulator [Arachnia rubra]QUC07654.1 winged helix-turn-helix transcriptional regulator [Arachnia rubra]BCR81959.1 MarR family transcriptional regulator [Arachnia rubra]
MDEVDEVMAAWHRERPDLATSPMAVWSRIHRLAALLDAARKRCFAEHGLDNWEFDVLAALRRAGEPYQLSPGQLLHQTHVTSGTMTNRVDRLCDRGLVTRHAAPSDGRSVVVGLTGAGRRAVDNALEALVELEESLLAGWSAGERESLAAMLRRLLA